MPLDDKKRVSFEQFMRKNGVQRTSGAQNPTYGHEQMRQKNFPQSKNQEWQGYVERQQQVKGKGIGAYQNWRNSQIEKGYTFRPNWEAAKDFQYTPKPYPKNYWEPQPDGRYNGELAFYEDVANKFNEQELPPGAIGWTPNGRPYYGGTSDYQEWQLRSQANMRIGETTSAEEASFSDWDAPNILKSFQDGGILAAGQALLGGAVEAVDQVNEWTDYQLNRATGSDDKASASLNAYRNAVYKVKSPIMAAIYSAGDIPKVLGGLMNAGHFLEGRPTWDEYDAIEAKRLQDAGDPNWYSKAVHIAYKEPTWANIKAEFWEGYENSEWLYSAMWDNFKGDPKRFLPESPFDPTGPGSIKLEQMKRELQADPSLNPYLLAEKYENPWVELVGEAVLDPLNVVGWFTKPLVQSRRVAGAISRYGKYGDEVLEAVQGMTKGGRIGKLDDLASDATKMTAFVEARGRQVKRIEEGVEQLAQSKGILQYTNGAKAHELAMEFDAVSEWATAAAVGEVGFDPEVYFDIVDQVSKTVRGNADEAASAWNELSKYEGWDILLTDPGARGAMLANDLASSQGTIKKMLNAEDFEEMFQIADDWIEGASKKYFPTLAQRIDKGEDIGAGWKFLSKFHELTRPIYNTINGIFSFAYMGLSPGYASRNFLQNNFQSWLDEGFSATVFGKWGSEDLVKSWAGIGSIGKEIRGMKAGMGVARDLAGQNSKGLINWLGQKAPFSRLGAAAEDMQSAKIYGKVYPQTMKRILGKRDLPAELVRRGVPEDKAKAVFDTLLKHKGDVDAAFDDIIKQADVGYRTSRDQLLNLSPQQSKFLDETGLAGRFEEILRTSTTKEAAKAEFDDVWKQFLDWAEEGVLKEVPTVVDEPTGMGTYIARMVDKGADRGVTRALVDQVNVNSAANFEYKRALDNITRSWADVLAGAGQGYENSGKMVNKWLNEIKFDVGGQQMSATKAILQDKITMIAKAEHDRIYSKWEGWINEALGAIKSKDQKTLSRLWDEAGLAAEHGAYEPDKKILERLWRGYDGEARSFWQAHREDHSSKVIQALDYVKDKVDDTLGHITPDYGEKMVKANKSLERARKFDSFLHKRNIRTALNNARRNKDIKSALFQWAKQYRINLTGYSGGKKPPIAKYSSKLGKVSNMSEDEIMNVADLLTKAGERDAGKRLGQAYFARKSFMAENAEDIEKFAISGAEGVDITKSALGDRIAEVDQILEDAAVSARHIVDDITHKTLEETGAKVYAVNEKLLNILNSQLNKNFKSIDDVTWESLQWGDAEGALLAHALDDRINLYSDPERGMGMLRRFLHTPDPMGTFTDKQMREAIDMLDALKLEEPKLYGEIRQLSKEWLAADKNLLRGIDDADAKMLREDLDGMAEELQKKLDQFENILRESEPEELAHMVNKQYEDLPKRTGEFTTWSGQDQFTDQRAFWEQKDDLARMQKEISEHILGEFDKRQAFKLSSKERQMLREAKSLVKDEVQFARRISGEVSRATRNFVLHDYKAKRNIDLAVGYLMPYSFWYSRTYAKYLAKIPTNPGVAAAYVRYKKKLAEIHHDMPEWWKYNINLNELLGIDSENPLYFNLEATLNPLNGITGVDFNDPSKRTNWFTSAVDQVGKYGPSVYTPLTMGIGYYYYLQGEKELGEKWAGRLIPQSSGIKAISALLGANGGRGIEIDPNVNIMGGGLDLWERKRVGRALGWAVENGQISEEEAIEAARTKEGAIWDNAVAIAQSKRSWGNLGSMFLGVGFKARTIEDIKIDKMDAEYSRFIKAKGDMSPDEVAKAYDYFRTKYPFFDTVKLSRRPLDEIDGSYAYNVLGRIPPGMKGDAYKAVGITYEQTQEFYANKGIPEDWKESEKAKFFEGMVQLGAILAMPDGATKQEWREVKRRDQEMYTLLKEQYGEHIQDAESMYWDIYQTEGWEKAKEWMQSNPDVQQYMNDKVSYRMNDPLLAKYYASFDKARSLLKSRREIRLNQDFPGIQTLVDGYYEAKLAGKGKEYLKEHPEVQKYWDAKGISEQAMYEMLLSFETWLPEGDEIAQPQFRGDETALAGYTEEDMALMDKILQEDSRPEYLQYDYNRWLDMMNPTLQRIVNDWVKGEEMLSYNAEKQLEYALEDAGVDASPELAKLLIFRAGRGYGPNPK